MSDDLILKLKLKADGSGLTGTLENAKGEIKEFGETTEREAGRASNAMGKTAKSVDNVSDRLGGLERTAGNAVKALAGFVALQAGFDQAKQLTQTIASYQDMTTRLEGLSSSAAAFADNEQYLIDLAGQHHKDLLVLGDGYSRILALEQAQIVSREEGREILEGLSNASSKLGASNEQLEQSLYGLAQGLSAGTLRAEELNQITEPLPGLLQALDRASGQAAGGFRQLVNDGQITSDMFRDTLIVAFQDYEGAAAATADNLNAKYADIRLNYTLLARELEEPITDVMNPVLTATADTLKYLTANTDELLSATGTLTQVSLTWLAAYKGAPVLLKAVAASQLMLNGTISAGTVRMTAATVATKAWRTGLMMLGGPAGVAIIAGITAITFAVSQQQAQVQATSDLLDEVTQKANSYQEQAQTESGLTASLEAEKQALAELKASIAPAQESLAGLQRMISSGAYSGEMLQDLKDSYQKVQSELSATDGSIDAHQAKIKQLEDALGDLTGKNAAVATAAADQQKAFNQLANGLNEQIVTLEGGKRAQFEYRLSQKDLTDDMKATLLALYDYKQGLSDAQKSENEAAAEKEKLQGWYASFQEQVDPAAAALNEYNETLSNLKTLLGEGSAEYELMAGRAKTLYDEATKSPFDELNEQLSEELRLMKMTGREQAIAIQLRQLGANAAQEEKDAIRQLTGELYDAQQLLKDDKEEKTFVDRLFDINANDLEKQLKPLYDMIDELELRLTMPDLSDEMEKNIRAGIKQLKDDVDQVEFDHIADNAKDGLRSIQTMTEEGSKGYQALGIAVNALSAVQAVQAVVLQLSSGDPYTVFARAAAAAAAVASLGFSISGYGGSDSKPTMSDEQIGFETAKTDNESVVSRLDQQIELLEAIERNGSAAAINVDLAAAEYQGAIFEWVEDVFDSSRMGFVDAMFDESSSAWAAIEEHYANLEIANPYEMSGDCIRINAEQYYQDPTALIAVIKDIAAGDFYSGPFGQSIADEYGYGEGAQEAFRAAMRSSFTELQEHLNDWAVTSIESLTDLSDASETMKESFDAITGTSRYATAEITDAYDALEQIAGSNYAGYLEDNIDAISNAEGWLEQLSNSYGENGKQLSNFQLLLSKDAELFEEQAVAVEQFGAILGGTFQGGAEEALNLMSSIEIVAESMKKTHELEDQILQLTNSEEHLITMRRRELETLTESQQVLQKQVWALEDWAEAQAAAAQIGDMIDDALSPLSSAEKTLDSANRAMTALGMSGLTYQDALASIQDYDTDDIVNLADALGMSFADIQEMIQQIINGNEQITGGGSGVLSVSAAESAVDAAAGVIRERYGDIIDDTFGGQIPTLQEFNRVYGDQADQLKIIQSDNAAIINQLGGMPSSVADLKDAYFDQFGGLDLVEPVDELGIQIANAYNTLLGRLPDQAGLDYWISELKADASIDDVINSIKGNAEFAEYGQYQDLREDMQAYLDDNDADIVGLDTAIAAWDAATDSYNQALIDNADSATGAVNSAAASFLQGVKNELGGFDLDGEDLEQYELDLWYDGMVAQANELGVELTQLNELYGKKQVAITEKYADEAAEALQKALDFDANIQSQIDSFGLEGEDLELFQLDQWHADQIEQADAIGGDLVKVEELYGLKRAEIAEQYAQEAAEKLVEDAGLHDYLQSVSDYVDEQSKVIEDSYRDQIAVIEQWQDVARDLGDYVDQIRLSELSPLGPGEKLQEAQESFAALLVAAEAGDLEAADKLTGAADTYLNLSDQYYGRSDAYTAVFNEVTSALDDLGIDLLEANDQDVIEQLNRQMNGELEDLGNYARQELAWAQTQANSLTGIEGALGSWPTQFDEMLSGLAGDIGSAVAAAIPDRSSVSVSVSAPSTPYSPDKSGNYWDLKAAQNIPGSASITDPNLPAFATGGDHLGGWRIVGERGPELEATGPSRIFNAMDTQRILSGSNSAGSDPALLRLIESLVASNQRLEAEVALLRSDRSSADKDANDKRDKLIKATKHAGRQKQEVI